MKRSNRASQESLSRIERLSRPTGTDGPWAVAHARSHERLLVDKKEKFKGLALSVDLVCELISNVLK
jgi:hypothetical protein